jgi:hypothetical protein
VRMLTHILCDVRWAGRKERGKVKERERKRRKVKHELDVLAGLVVGGEASGT